MADLSNTFLEFDIDDLTIGEMEDLEEAAGISVGQLGELTTSNISAKTLKAIAWVMARRSDPTITLDDMRDVKVKALGVSLPNVQPAPITPMEPVGRSRSKRAS